MDIPDPVFGLLADSASHRATAIVPLGAGSIAYTGPRMKDGYSHSSSWIIPSRVHCLLDSARRPLFPSRATPPILTSIREAAVLPLFVVDNSGLEPAVGAQLWLSGSD